MVRAEVQVPPMESVRSAETVTCECCGLEVPRLNMAMHELRCTGPACERCTFVNEAGAEVCAVCDTELGQSTEGTDDCESMDVWDCVQCTFRNTMDTDTCCMCENHRDEDAMDDREGSSASSEPPSAPIQIDPIDFGRTDTGLRRRSTVNNAEPAPNETQWSCGGCTYLNGAETNLCEMCDTPRVQPAAPPHRASRTSRVPDLYGNENDIFGSVAGSLVGAAMGATLASFDDHPTAASLLTGAGLGAMTGAGVSSVLSQAMGMVDRGTTQSMGVADRNTGHVIHGFPDDVRSFLERMNLEELAIADSLDGEQRLEPAHEQTIAQLPTHSATADDTSDMCVICQDPYREQDEIKTLPCLHRFHSDHIDPWLSRRGSCPVCKHSVC